MVDNTNTIRDPFDNELSEGTVVLQDNRAARSCLRLIVEIDLINKPGQVKLGPRLATYDQGPAECRPTWVRVHMVTKWCNQEAFNV